MPLPYPYDARAAVLDEGIPRFPRKSFRPVEQRRQVRQVNQAVAGSQVNGVAFDAFDNPTTADKGIRNSGPCSEVCGF